jgi:hypothetical protein
MTQEQAQKRQPGPVDPVLVGAERDVVADQPATSCESAWQPIHVTRLA